jgi:hypothetical protein
VINVLIAEINIETPCPLIVSTAINIRRVGLLEEKLENLHSILPLPKERLNTIGKVHVKVATGNAVKIVIISDIAILDDLEMASVRFPDNYRHHYPINNYPHCKVIFLDTETNITGLFSTLLERTETESGSKYLLKESQRLLRYMTDK